MNKLSKKELIDEVKKNNTSLFRKFYYEDPQYDNKYKIVWELNWGDGNELFVAINFPEENINVLLSGYYSSWDSDTFNKVSLSVPYEHVETRYRELSESEIRDMKIDNILEDE
jgi:hypothetical protein